MKLSGKKGFTLLELLMVVAIIGLLTAVVLASLSAARRKGRDARRLADMHEIVNALYLYYDQYGCLPTTSSSTCPPGTPYVDANAGGWDYSSQPVGTPTFLSFLQTAGYISNVPVDPINNMTGDGTPAGTYSYKYYCYTGGPWFGPHLGYWRESDGQYITIVPQGGNMATNRTDTTINCK